MSITSSVPACLIKLLPESALLIKSKIRCFVKKKKQTNEKKKNKNHEMSNLNNWNHFKTNPPLSAYSKKTQEKILNAKLDTWFCT